MPNRQAVIRLTETEIQAMEQAILDRDANSALDFLDRVIAPHVEEAIGRPRCKPVFELGAGAEQRPPRAAR
jgi:hypothetical protein